VYGAPASYGGAIVGNGVAGTVCTGTATAGGGVITGLGVATNCGAGYSNGPTASGPEHLIATMQGSNAGGTLTTALVLDGVEGSVVDYLHTEFIGAGGYALQLGGGSNLVAGGEFHDINGSSTVLGGLVHIEPGVDTTAHFWDTHYQSKTGTPNMMFDESVSTLAWFLHSHAEDHGFWTDWKELHDDSLRQLEAVSFRLARDWFDCSLHGAVEEEVRSLSPDVKRYCESPLDSVVRSNKHALWLHLSLLKSTRDKTAVFRSALLPIRVPPLKAVRRCLRIVS
jgi:hypothetical protein